MHFVQAKSILSASNGMNIYRGCSHGCIYCDARSKCYQMDHDFEDIAVKENALELLELVEPKVCTTRQRYEVLKECQRRGIATVVWMCPATSSIKRVEKTLIKSMFSLFFFYKILRQNCL